MFPKTFTLLLMIVGFCFLGMRPLAAQETGISLPALAPITPTNVAQFEPLARLGTGTLSDAIAWSPDGNTLAAGGSVALWLYQTADLNAAPERIPTDGAVTQVGYTSDGKVLAYIANHKLYVREVATHTLMAEFENAYLFALHPSQNWLAIERLEPTVVPEQDWPVWLSSIELWDIQTNQMLKKLPFGPGDWGGSEFVKLAFSPDGRQLGLSWLGDEQSTCGERSVTVYLWPVEEILRRTEDELSDPETHIGTGWWYKYDLVFNPTNTHFATVQWDSSLSHQPTYLVDYYDTASQKTITFSLGMQADRGNMSHTVAEQITALTISPDGKTMAAGLWSLPQNVIRFLDIETGTVQREWQLETTISALAYSPNGRWLAVAGDGQIWVGDTSGEQEAVLGTLRDRDNGQRNTSGTAFLSRDIHDQLNLWLIVQNTIVSQSIPEAYTSGKARFVPGDNQILFYDQDKKWLTLWNYHTGQETELDRTQVREIEPSINFSPNGNQVALETITGQVKIYNTTTGTLLATLPEVFANHVQIVFSPDESQLMTTHYQEIEDYLVAYAEVKQWDSATGELIHDYGSFRGAERTDERYQGEISVQFNLDGTKIAVSNTYYETASDSIERQHQVAIYDASNGKRLFNHDHTEGDCGLLSSDFSLYAVNFGDWSSVVIALFDTSPDEAQSEDKKSIYSPFGGGVQAFSPDHQQLLVVLGSYTNCGGDYRAAELYDTQTLQVVTEVHLPSVMGGWGTEAITFSPSSDLLLASTGYGTEIIDTQSGEERAYLQALDNSNLYFNQDATLLIAVRRDGTITLWGVPQ